MTVKMFMKVLLFVCYFACGCSFQVGLSPKARRATSLPSSNNGNNSWNPFKEVSDMVSSLDDVIDDFLNKRMGNGEIFYGQRAYKPSGRENTTGRYTGMGMSDKTKIDMAREYKEEMLEMRRLKEEGLKRGE